MEHAAPHSTPQPARTAAAAVPPSPSVGEDWCRPTREELAQLEPFVGLQMDEVRVPATPEEAHAALAELSRHAWLGFDTESKPTFARGESSSGPHLVQFATLEGAFLFQLKRAECLEAVRALLARPDLLKVGFGLDTDLTQLEARLGCRPQAVLDLDEIFRRRGYGRSLGVKNAVAIVFGQQFHKSRRMTTSNWGEPRLSERQLLYAANDAYAAARVYHELGTPPPPPVEIPVPKPPSRHRFRRRRRSAAGTPADES
ncbi:MAG: 3'-5' exonuclease [Candidatus Delongbacteria bacterium]